MTVTLVDGGFIEKEGKERRRQNRLEFLETAIKSIANPVVPMAHVSPSAHLMYYFFA